MVIPFTSVVGPVYQIQRDGIKYTIIVKGYGANYVGVK